MARTGWITAGFALSAVLVLAASCDAVPPKASKTIAPPKAEIVTQTAVAVPKPRPDPAAGARKTQPTRTARHIRHGGSLARNSRTYRYSDSRPMSGPVYEAGRGQPPGTGCDEACRYRVSGGAMPARWWSVTVYADDDYLPQNEDNALSFDATRVKTDAAGNWQALVSPRRDAAAPDMAWASSNKAGRFTLTLRLYNPSPAVQANSALVPLPLVTRIDCGGRP